MKLLREILKTQPYDFLNHTKTSFDHDSHAELHESLKKHYNGVKSVAAEAYQEGDSKSMNGTLWAIHNNNKAIKYISQDVATHAPKLQKTLLSQKTPHDLHVWSGTPIDPRQIKDKDNVVHHPAFLSTSLREGIAVNFARKRAKTYSSKDNDTIYKNHLLKIHVPEGHPGLYMGNHDPNSFGKSEKEFILPAGTNLKHIKTETFNHDSMERDSFARNVFHVHHMEVMPHKNKKFPIAEPKSKDT